MADIHPEREKQPDPDKIVGDAANIQLHNDVKFTPITTARTTDNSGPSEQLAFNGGEKGFEAMDPAEFGAKRGAAFKALPPGGPGVIGCQYEVHDAANFLVAQNERQGINIPQVPEMVKALSA